MELFFVRSTEKIYIHFSFNSNSIKKINLGDLYRFLLNCFPVLHLIDGLKNICLKYLVFADKITCIPVLRSHTGGLWHTVLPNVLTEIYCPNSYLSLIILL